MNASALAPYSEKALLDELDAICASGAFRHSPQQQRFLRHLVAKCNAGEVGSLREMALGIDVFHRPVQKFDPKKDPIVRVEARRLRERLARYYALEGERSQIEIVVPIGSYVPIVRGRSLPADLAGAKPAGAKLILERAGYVMRLRTIEGYRKALELYSRAVDDFPDIAAPHLGIAWARICTAGFDAVPSEARDQAAPVRAAIEAAAALDPSNPEVAALRAAYASRFDHDLGVAERLYREGMSRNPTTIACRTSFAWLYVLTGRFDDAQRLFENAQSEDPFGFWHRHNLGSLAFFRRDYAAAETVLREALELEPDHAVVRMVLARVLTHSGRGADALAETEWCMLALPGMTGPEIFHVIALASAGGRNAAIGAMRAFEHSSADRYTPPVYRAMAYAALGEVDRALEWLSRAAIERDYWLINVAVDPAFDRLRSRREFSAILRAVGLPELHFTH